LQIIHGVDTLQALALAFEFIRVTIRKWEEKGFVFGSPKAENCRLKSGLSRRKNDANRAGVSQQN